MIMISVQQIDIDSGSATDFTPFLLLSLKQYQNAVIEVIMIAEKNTEKIIA